MDRRHLQKEHEKFLGSKIFSLLGLECTFQRFGNPLSGEPDLFFNSRFGLLGIEVTLAYYDDSDAEDEWKLATGEREFAKEGFEMRRRGLIWEPDNLIRDRVNARLSEKLVNTYSGADETWLLIEIRAAVTNKKTLETMIEDLKPKLKHSYSRIYLLLRDGSEYVYLQLV